MNDTIQTTNFDLILLGAGASVTAGIPSATQMTEMMIKRLEQSQWPYHQVYLRTLKLAVGGLRFQKSITTGSPFDAINIEEVFNAIDLLNRRQSLEIAPFVAMWHTAVAEIDTLSALPLSLKADNVGKKIIDMVMTGSTFSFSTEFVEAVKSISKKGSRNNFGKTLEEMRRMLLDMAWLESNANINYLQPLVKYAVKNSTPIITLNYDNTVELCCSKIGISCDRGIDNWSQQSNIQFHPKSLHLIKLHGSIDWLMEKLQPSKKSPLPGYMLSTLPFQEKPKKEIYTKWLQSAYLIFGGHNKLTAEGPFLDLYKEFQTRLSGAQSMLAVGYSFSDPHVNYLLANWLNGDTKRVLQIMNGPEFNLFEIPLFKNSIQLLDNRVQSIQQYAEEGIIQLFSDY